MNSIKLNLLRMFGSNTGVFIIQFITTLILARIFTPLEFGIVGAILIFTSFTDIILNFGVNSAVIQKKNLTNQDINTAKTISVIIGLIATVSTLVLSDIISNFLRIESSLYIELISLGFIINSLGIVPSAIFQREFKFKYIVIKDIISTIVFGVTAIIFGILDHGLFALIYAYLLKYLTSTLLILYLNNLRYKFEFSILSAKKILQYGWWQTVSDFFNVIGNQGDNLVINRNLGNFELGLYSRMYQLGAISAFILGQVIDMVFFPYYSKNQDNLEKIAKIYLTLKALALLIYIPLSLILFIFSEEIILLLLGPNWIDGAIVFQILSLTMVFRFLYKLSDPIFRALGKTYLRAKLQIVFAVLIIIASLMGTKWGLVGVSIGVSLVLIMNYFLITIYTLKLLNIKITKLTEILFPQLVIFIIAIISITSLQLNFESTSSLILISIDLFILIITFILSFVISPRHIKIELKKIIFTKRRL